LANRKKEKKTRGEIKGEGLLGVFATIGDKSWKEAKQKHKKHTGKKARPPEYTSYEKSTSEKQKKTKKKSHDILYTTPKQTPTKQIKSNTQKPRYGGRRKDTNGGKRSHTATK